MSRSFNPQSLRRSFAFNGAQWLATIGTAALCTACPAGEPVCGDAIVDVTEECDDGNTHAGDGCDALCVLEAGYACGAPGEEPCTATAVCGDGVIAANEQCDDGTFTGFGPCAFDCTFEGPYCGDGIVDTEFEECDEGEGNGFRNGCAIDCTIGPYCGDGVVNSEFEVCDDGLNLGIGGPGACMGCTQFL